VVHEILRHLPDGAAVLDLGSGAGSFDRARYPRLRVICLDRESGAMVRGDAAQLPFRDASFDAIVSNHSLEHIERLDQALDEIRRVLRADGSLYVAVPDASTITDRLYRWLFRGGGHVNSFRDADAFEAMIARATGLKCAARRTLISSFLFLGARHFKPRPPRRLWVLGGGDLRVVAIVSYAARWIDRWIGTRASVYGWAFYFGRVGEAVDATVWSNVCVGCGAGRSSAALVASGKLRRGWMRSYRCAGCGAWNLFTGDGAAAR
jgi:SAM-dependent methyltransferase